MDDTKGVRNGPRRSTSLAALVGVALVMAAGGLRTAGLPLAGAQASSSQAPPASSGDTHPRLASWTIHQRLQSSSPFRSMHWEALGPSMQGGRIEAIAAVPGSSTLYVGPGAGNVWKTVNNGITWEPIFEHESAFAIGDIAVAPSNPNIVWVGTGEVQPRHSGPAYAGTGVFKSADAGRTWQHVGLTDTYHIGKVLVDPRNPDVVYVAAMGHFWSRNSERGVFRTTDGGRSWAKVLYVSDQAGAIDLAMDPSDANTIYASMWQLVSGPESGIYRTRDGGKTWKKLEGGLPPGPLGRSNIDVSRTNPRVVYVFLDNNAPSTIKGRAIVGGEVYRSDDRGETWRRANTDDLYDVFGIYGWKFCDIRVAPDNENEIYILGNRMFRSTDGGRTYKRIGETIRRVNAFEGTAMHLDHHELWVDPANPARLVLGNDGGVFMSYDHGETWLHLNNLPIGQFYTVALDMADPYTIFGGTQDNGALSALSTYRPDDEAAENDGWRRVWLDRWTGGDAFFTWPDPADARMVYYEHQNGDMRRINVQAGIPFSGGPATESIRPPAGGRDDKPWRFGWQTPYLVSQHDARTLYAAANVVFKSTNRGAGWRVISPDLGEPAGGERAVIPYGSITSIAESPFAPGILYAGTEGGGVYVTRNDGGEWKRVTEGLPRKWVTRLVASQHDVGTAYLSMSGYREDDFTSYLFRSTDFGASWTPIAAGLPSEPINVVREDPKRANVLYAGTDAGVYVSLDRGGRWLSLCADLPTTPVMDLVVHPREDELIVATHGRSMFLLDVRPIQALDDTIPASPLHLFDLRPVRLRWQVGREVPPNPPAARVRIHYWLGAPGPVSIAVRDATGSIVREWTTNGTAGVNRADWDARTKDGRDVKPGMYDVDVTAAGRTVPGRLVIRPFSG